VNAVAERLTKAGQRFVDDMTRCRGMGWVRLGMQVEVDGHLGTIKGMNSGANLDVVFANQLKYGKGKYNCHPTWQTRYFDAEGNVIRDYTTKPTAELIACSAGRDGECAHAQCPQQLDNEPRTSGRYCPLDNQRTEA